MKWYVIVIIIIIAFLIGYYGYRLIPFNYTPNIPPLLEISFDELKALDQKSKKENLNEKEKQEIVNRQEEIYSLLKEFFGKDIRNELVY